MQPEPDTITITATHAHDVEATHAHVYVAVQGTSGPIFAADQVLARAKEVNALVSALAPVGIGPADVDLIDIHTESKGGRISRSTSALYRLRLRTHDRDAIPGILDVVAAQPHSGIESIEWQYPESESQRAALDRALDVAAEKAEFVAQGLGVLIAGVHRFTEHSYDEGAPRPFMAKAEAMQADSPTLAIEVTQRKRVRVNVEVTYLIAQGTEAD